MAGNVRIAMMEIVQGVHKIPGTFWSALYLIEGKDSLALVDSGSPGDGRKVEEYLRVDRPRNSRTSSTSSSRTAIPTTRARHSTLPRSRVRE